jgi:hypothetical protein
MLRRVKVLRLASATHLSIVRVPQGAEHILDRTRLITGTQTPMTLCGLPYKEFEGVANMDTTKNRVLIPIYGCMRCWKSAVHRKLGQVVTVEIDVPIGEDSHKMVNKSFQA